MTLIFHGQQPDATTDPRGPVWITAMAPTPDEIARLAWENGFDRDEIDHALDPNERPRVKVHDRSNFVVLRTPWPRDNDAGVPFVAVQVGVVFGASPGLTICARDIPVVRRLAGYADQTSPGTCGTPCCCAHWN